MRPSEVRQHVLRDHDELRGRIEEIDALARRLDGGEADTAFRLWCLATALLERLHVHMGWEDLYLVPALRDADSWGRERAQELEKEHAEQREMLQYVVARLDQPRPTRLLARTLLDLSDFLRRDMAHEEVDLLDPRVLKDDVVNIDVFTG